MDWASLCVPSDGGRDDPSVGVSGTMMSFIYYTGGKIRPREIACSLTFSAQGRHGGHNDVGTGVSPAFGHFNRHFKCGIP
jgi:hypothetical protein